MLNIDSRLNLSLKKLGQYNKQAIQDLNILERQFGTAMLHLIIVTARKFSFSTDKVTFKRPPSRQRKLHVRSEADPKRIIAWAVAQRVREARERQGLRQNDLAKISGIARPNIVRLEQGRHIPTLATLKKIADTLVLDINSLMTQPKVTNGDKLEFRKIAGSGLEEWREKLKIEDDKA